MSPIARPIASKADARSRPQTVDVRQIRTGQDEGVPSSLIRRRVSAGQLAEIDATLPDRDREALVWIQQMRVVTAGQLQRMFWPGDANAARSARRALLRLAALRIIDRLDRRIGGVRAGSSAYLYRVGPVGWRLMALRGFSGRRVADPSDRLIAHTIAIAEIVTRLHEAHRTGELELIAYETEPACWRPFVVGFGARSILKPDLFLRIGAGHALEDRWLVEVDMGTQHAGVLRGKCARYADHYISGTEQREHDVYPRVLWATTHRDRAEVLERLIAGQREPQLHNVTTQDAVIGFLGAEARS